MKKCKKILNNKIGMFINKYKEIQKMSLLITTMNNKKLKSIMMIKNYENKQ